MKIVLIVDMQKDFISGPLGSEAAIAAKDAVCKYLKNEVNSEALIVFTQDSHNIDYLESNEGRHLPILHCIEGTDGWKIDKEIMTTIRDRPCCDLWFRGKETFGSVNIMDEITKVCKSINDIEEIDIMGLCTDICVVSNALILKAMLPESTIKVVANCCAGTSVEMHEAALKVMESCQVEVIR